jgi:hypothetical protein
MGHFSRQLVANSFTGAGSSWNLKRAPFVPANSHPPSNPLSCRCSTGRWAVVPGNTPAARAVDLAPSMAKKSFGDR